MPRSKRGRKGAGLEALVGTCPAFFAATADDPAAFTACAFRMEEAHHQRKLAAEGNLVCVRSGCLSRLLE